MPDRIFCVGLAVALLFAAGGAAAQTALAANEAAKAVVGAWELSNAERDRSCMVTLRPPGSGPTAAVTWEAQCAELFPFSRNAPAWNIGEMDAIQFLDGKGQVVLELTEVEGGLYEGERRGEGIFFLQSAGVPDERKADFFVGEWAFAAASGRVLCRLTLALTPVPPDAMALKLKSGCPGAIAGFAPIAWRVDRGELLILSASGENWRFEEAEPSVWQRVPQSRQPLRLLRQ
ncbi:MAG TPA: AprI/Inh family metalloprotease inhibitor [Xanthobacteraceae bacterium]|nr:AprI/Inh family metalloprotease inhibitor [Xanthobacteraceae bacterium]